MKTINQDPTISDDVLFTITTTDSNGDLADPDSVDNVSIYFIERSFFDGNYNLDVISEPEGNYTTYFKEAIPFYTIGDGNSVAWDGGVELITNISTGTFTLNWQPSQQGDYFICWKWTVTGNSYANFYQFYINGDTQETTSIPTHYTITDKYEKLLDKYLPAFIKLKLTDNDITPDVITRYNSAIAKVFTNFEDQVNQLVDFTDANVVPTNILPYLAFLFNLKLRSNDSVLWRKQIKTAIPLYKKKGTMESLTAALGNAGITLNSFSMLWQVVSPVTWREGIKVETDSQTIFTLQKLAIIDMSLDYSNFDLLIRPYGTTDYILLDVSLYVEFSNSDSVTTMTWIGEGASPSIVLAAGDFLDIIYKIAEPVNQSTENYTRTLPLADQRDETLVTYPQKNWNVRLISEDDSMFNVVCSVKHPFVTPLIFGKVRTEFPYSENIYNMEEYSGCCVGETPIVTENGMKQIKNITTEDKFILTEFGFKKFDGLKHQGKRKTLKIKTKMGRELTVTKNHQFRIINNGILEWKTADSLKLNDYILGKKGSTTLIPKNLGCDKDIWYLAGYGYGDGWLHGNTINWLVPEDEEESKILIEKILNIKKCKFSSRIRYPSEHQKNTNLQCNKFVYLIKLCRNYLPILNEIMPKYQRKGKWKEKLPQSIWSSGEDQICAFISGIFDSDGTIQRGKPMLTTKWKSLAKEMQRLLLLLGIISSVTSFKAIWNGRKRKYYRVRIIGQNSTAIFAEKISFRLTRKKYALDNNYFSSNVKGEKQTILSSDRTIIPHASGIINSIFPFKNKKSKNKVKNRSKQEKRILTLITRLKQGYQQTIPDNVVLDILDKANEYGEKNTEDFKFLENYIVNSWFFDEIKAISIGKEEDVYDPLNVDETKSYVSDGLISHNSTRDSTNACDLDKTFLDTCTCCRSSKFNINLTINDLSDDRISEANQIIREFKPFHLQAQNTTIAGGINEICISPIEEIQFLIQHSGGESPLVSANGLFSRHMPLDDGENESFNAPLRNVLASLSTVISSVSGTGHNENLVLYSGVRFDSFGISSDNLLEVLSGTSTGDYTCTLLTSHILNINQGSPDNLPYPLESGEHTYRLSNIIYTNAVASIYQDNLFIFSDISLNFNAYPVVAGWTIDISNGTNPGIYTINTVLSDNTVCISSWPGSNISGLHYQLKNLSNITQFTGTTGEINITNRGRVEVGVDVYSIYGVANGYYLLYDGNQYVISGFNTGSKFYINLYNSGNVVGVANVKILKRLVENDLGFLDVYGQYIVSGINYETGLGILNGNSQDTDGMPDIDSNFKENYLILIGSDYYRITEWDGTTISLSGPKLDWGLAGTPVTYSIIAVNKTEDIISSDHTFRKIDRSGNDVIVINTISAMAMNNFSGNSFTDFVGQDENIEIIIQKV